MTPLLKLLIGLSLALDFTVPLALAFDASVTVNQNGTNFVYTVFNDEPAGSSLILSSFHIDANAPFSVAATPPGWTFRSDNFSYVDWLATNAPPPFSNSIPPGGSLSGFILRGLSPASALLSYSLVSWDVSTNGCGPAVQNDIGAPCFTNLAPVLAIVTNSGNLGIQFTVEDYPSFSYVTQSSTNLTDWNPIATNAAPFAMVNTNGWLPPLNFYRCLFLPDPASWAVLGD